MRTLSEHATPKRLEETAKTSQHHGAWQSAVDNSPLQRKQAIQLRSIAPVQRKENKTGLPDQLKSGIEHLSGMAMDQVKVHYNSAKPSQLHAHAFAQGNDIHVASGQEKHLPHEAWHVVQQRQGRVKPTTSVGAAAVNDSPVLEKEADVMGERAIQLKPEKGVKDGRKGSKPANLTHIKSGTPTELWENNSKEDVKEADFMEAWPITRDQWETGSRTNGDVRGTSQHAKRVFGRSFVTGHLLNHYLGGTGTSYSNITAFTSRSNSMHLHGIESEIKSRVKNEGQAIWYEVSMVRPGKMYGNKNLGIANMATELRASFKALTENGDMNNKSDYSETGGDLIINLNPGAEEAFTNTGQVFSDEAVELLDSLGWDVGDEDYEELVEIFSESTDMMNAKSYLKTQITNRISSSIANDLIQALNL